MEIPITLSIDPGKISGCVYFFPVDESIRYFFEFEMDYKLNPLLRCAKLETEFAERLEQFPNETIESNLILTNCLIEVPYSIGNRGFITQLETFIQKFQFFLSPPLTG